MATVNLTTNDYASQLAAIARRQKYAELLAQQGAEDIDVQSVGGIPTPISPFQGLAKVLKSGMGSYLGRKAGEDEAEATAAEKNAVNEERARIFGMNPAVAATPLSQRLQWVCLLLCVDLSGLMRRLIWPQNSCMKNNLGMRRAPKKSQTKQKCRLPRKK